MDGFVQRLQSWERLTDAVAPSLLRALAPTPGDRLLDVGCGAGGTTLRAAALVASEGTVVGADVSAPAVECATARARAAQVGNAAFRVADVQTARIDGGPFTAVMSQFGVMFFPDPVAAFANVRAHLAPRGRLGFACWQPAAGNPWSYAGLLAERLPPPPASGAGPFALADAERVRDVLRRAGFVGVEVAPQQGAAEVPEEGIVNDGELTAMGVAPDRLAEARARVAEHIAPYRTAGGLLRVPLAWFVVTARAAAA